MVFHIVFGTHQARAIDRKEHRQILDTFLIPDSGMMNGRLNGISAFPETFFVDKNGNIVGETYSGSHSLDEWKEIVEKELENVTEGK